MINPETGEYESLAIYLPSLNLAFAVPKTGRSTEDQANTKQAKENATKSDLARSKGIALITLPYRWHGSVRRFVYTFGKSRNLTTVIRLRDAILQERPDLENVLPPVREKTSSSGMVVKTSYQ